MKILMLCDEESHYMCNANCVQDPLIGSQWSSVFPAANTPAKDTTKSCVTAVPHKVRTKIHCCSLFIHKSFGYTLIFACNIF